MATEHILVVEDEVKIADLLRDYLEKSGYAVTWLGRGEEVLAHIRNQMPDLILLDLMLPGMNGMELQAELAARDVDLPIVFLTGHGDIPMSVQAMKRGAVDFLTKPVDERVLLDSVQQALRRHKSRRAERQEAEAMQARLQMLTSRELEVLRCVIAGARNKRIAAHLGIAEQTVKIHRARVMAKLGVHTWTELFQACQRAGIEPSPDL